MKQIKEEIELIMAKYLENRATEAESLRLLDALIESERMRARFNIMASGFNRMVKRRLNIDYYS